MIKNIRLSINFHFGSNLLKDDITNATIYILRVLSNYGHKLEFHCLQGYFPGYNNLSLTRYWYSYENAHN